MNDKSKDLIDFTGLGSEHGEGLNERTIELDISDNEQKMPEEIAPDAQTLRRPRKSRWIGLLLFTLVVIGSSTVSIFFLTSHFNGDFLMKTQPGPTEMDDVNEGVEGAEDQPIDGKIPNENSRDAGLAPDSVLQVLEIIPEVNTYGKRAPHSLHGIQYDVRFREIPFAKSNGFQKPSFQNAPVEPEPQRKTP